MSKSLPVTITMHNVPAARGRELVLAATEKMAKECWAKGIPALPPRATLALADVGRVFPGAKVIKIRLPQLGLRELE